MGFTDKNRLRTGACAVVTDAIFRDCARNDTAASYETITTLTHKMVQIFEENTGYGQGPALNQA